jgi:hypothetical protein
MKKMYVDVTVRLILNVNDDDAELSEIINELDYDFNYPVTTGYRGVEIEDSYIDDFEQVEVK